MDTHINCPQCGKSCHKFGLRNHIRYSHEGAPINHCGAAWNRGLTKDTDDRVRKNSVAVAISVRRFIDTLSPDERKAKYGGPKRWNPNTGGIRAGSGRGKKGWYKGYWCDSSWELAWVIYNLDHGVGFSRNTLGLTYSFEGRTHKFYPDFILPTGAYIEVKGWMDNRNRAKIAQFGGVLSVLGKKEMEPTLTYVTAKYGKDFIRLMGARPTNQCSCGVTITSGYKRCQSCAAKLNHKDKIEWPSLALLQAQVDTTGFEATGRLLGVSGSAVKKRIKKLVALAAFETAAPTSSA